MVLTNLQASVLNLICTALVPYVHISNRLPAGAIAENCARVIFNLIINVHFTSRHVRIVVSNGWTWSIYVCLCSIKTTRSVFQIERARSWLRNGMVFWPPLHYRHFSPLPFVLWEHLSANHKYIIHLDGAVTRTDFSTERNSVERRDCYLWSGISMKTGRCIRIDYRRSEGGGVHWNLSLLLHCLLSCATIVLSRLYDIHALLSQDWYSGQIILFL